MYIEGQTCISTTKAIRTPATVDDLHLQGAIGNK